MIFPLLSMDARAISSRFSCASCTSSSCCTASASAMESVMSTADAFLSCSAWLSRSAATKRGSDLPSASTSTSDGPAIMSMPTCPKTCFFASATKALPGPTILSTRGIDAVPYASAATACAPPTLKIRPTPATCAAARMYGLTEPSLFGGVTMTISSTPAIFAGIASISTVDGYAAVPPGT